MIVHTAHLTLVTHVRKEEALVISLVYLNTTHWTQMTLIHFVLVGQGMAASFRV